MLFYLLTIVFLCSCAALDVNNSCYEYRPIPLELLGRLFFNKILNKILRKSNVSGKFYIEA